jgi:hypothetical protein
MRSFVVTYSDLRGFSNVEVPVLILTEEKGTPTITCETALNPHLNLTTPNPEAWPSPKQFTNVSIEVIISQNFAILRTPTSA